MCEYILGWPYTIVYSPRKTITIKINPDNSITVRAPLGTSENYLRDVLKKNTPWLMKHLGDPQNTGPGRGYADGEFRKGTLSLRGNDVMYEVIYTNRSSMSLMVNYDGSVVVRAPAGTSQKSIVDFVETKSDWIYDRISEILEEQEKNKDIVEYKKILVGGKKFDLVKAPGFKITDDTVYCSTLSLLESLFVSTFGDALIKLTTYIAERMGVKPAKVQFKSYISRWGCCDSFGVITLNYKLLMIPRPGQEYIIVHELCHLFEMNHSKRFWTIVGMFMPDYKEREKVTHEYDFLLRLYP